MARAKIRNVTLRAYILLASAAILLASCAVKAQQNPDKPDLPDAPKPQQNPNGTDQNQQKNPLSNTLGLIARKSYFYPDLATSSRPLSSKEKFELFVSETVAAPQILSSAAAAGISEARGTLSGYGQGGEGFGKRYGAFMGDRSFEPFFWHVFVARRAARRSAIFCEVRWRVEAASRARTTPSGRDSNGHRSKEVQFPWNIGASLGRSPGKHLSAGQ